MCYICFVPRKNAIANVSLPPEIHAWVKAKITAILKAEPAANPTFTSVVADALRQKMNEEKQRVMTMEKISKPKTELRRARSKPSRKNKGA
jgi:hypothetical protein